MFNEGLGERQCAEGGIAADLFLAAVILAFTQTQYKHAALLPNY